MPTLPQPTPSPAAYAPGEEGVATPGQAPIPDEIPGAPARDPACPNCGTPAPLAYCPACGQAQRALHRSLRSIAGDLLDTFAGWDGKIPVTLWLLVRHPGRLTAEYLAGRRARFLPPIRLYLSLAVLLVLAFRLAPDRGSPVRLNLDGRTPAPATPAAAPASPGGDTALITSGPWRKLKRAAFGDRMETLERMPRAERDRAVGEAFKAKLGNMFLALVPIFALLTRWLYWRRPFVLAEHLVFALHVHAFAAGALVLAVLLPDGWWERLPVLWIPAYLAVALRTVYGGSWWRTLARLGLLGAGYAVALTAATTVTVLLALLVG